MRTVFIVVLSIALVLGFEAVYQGARAVLQRRSDELKRRLQSLGQRSEGGNNLIRRGRFAASPGLDSLLRSIPLAQRAEKLLESADSTFTVAQLGGYTAGLAVGALVLAIAFGFPLIPFFVLVASAASTPSALLAVAASRRSRKISEQLPEALDMMSRSLRAGHATSAAFQMVATEMPEPVSVEFARAFEEQRLGLSLEQAILHMTGRSPANRDLKIFATSAIIQRDTGGNLAELLAGIAETIRARYRFQGKLRTLTAEGRASGVVLAVIPLIFMGVLQLLNPSYLAPLLTEPAGRGLLMYALASWVLGLFWLHRLTKVDL